MADTQPIATRTTDGVQSGMRADIGHHVGDNDKKTPAVSKFESKFLLSTEHIRNLGVPEQFVDMYRKNHYRLQYAVEQWYEELQSMTFRTALIPISRDEGQAILNRHRAYSNHRRDCEKAGKSVNDEKFQFASAEVDAVVRRVAAAIEEHNMTEGFFVKLNTRSPKDAPLYGFRQAEIEQAISTFIKNASPEELDANAINSHFCTVVARASCLTTAEEMMHMFDCSFRIAEDLSAALQDGYPEELWKMKIVIREWNPQVPEQPWAEFRGFVHDKSLNALTQYNTSAAFPQLVQHKQAYSDAVQAFFQDKVRDVLTGHDSYVIDFIVLDTDTADRWQIFVIELNPFYTGAGTGCFSWKHDRELFLHGPYECRIIEQTPEDAADFLPVKWKKYIDRCIEGHHSKQKCVLM